MASVFRGSKLRDAPREKSTSLSSKDIRYAMTWPTMPQLHQAVYPENNIISAKTISIAVKYHADYTANTNHHI